MEIFEENLKLTKAKLPRSIESIRIAQKNIQEDFSLLCYIREASKIYLYYLRCSLFYSNLKN